MNQTQIQNEINIVKTMIEKTRRQTAESGLLFILPGILCIIMISLIAVFEMRQLSHLVQPTFLVFVVVIALSSAYIGIREGKKERVETYAKTVFSHLWIACGSGCLITGIVFPLLKVYSWDMVAVMPFIILAISFYMTGVIYELPMIQWCSLVWVIGACLLLLTQGAQKTTIMIAIFLFGYILPGIILNRQYKNRSLQDGS